MDSVHTIIPYFRSGTFVTGNIRGDLKTTDILMVNPTDERLTGMFTFYGQGSASSDASPVIVTINGQEAATFAYLIPPRSSRRYVMSPSPVASYSGSIQISPAAGTTAPAVLAVESTTRDGVL